MHETFPCRAFHLFEGMEEEVGGCRCANPCKFSHEPLDDVTRPLFEEDVRCWKAEAENAKEQSDDVKDISLLITRAMSRLGIRDDESVSGQSIDFGGYRGPYGKESLRHFATFGTVGLLSYARGNADKFKAYERANAASLQYDGNRHGTGFQDRPSPEWDGYEDDEDGDDYHAGWEHGWEHEWDGHDGWGYYGFNDAFPGSYAGWDGSETAGEDEYHWRDDHVGGQLQQDLKPVPVPEVPMGAPTARVVSRLETVDVKTEPAFPVTAVKQEARAG